MLHFIMAALKDLFLLNLDFLVVNRNILTCQAYMFQKICVAQELAHLFMRAKEWAKENGANKLYISAHSAVESQLFYKAMGCTEAQVYNQEHVKAEPYDCQLECKL